MTFTNRMVAMIDNTENKVEAKALEPKNTYQAPELIVYGTVADLTKTSSNIGGVPDSSFPGNKTS